MHRSRLVFAAAAIAVLFCYARNSDSKDDALVEVLPPRVVRVAQGENQLDNFLFPSKNESAARSQFESQLNAIVDEISLHCGISPVQVEKLRLGGMRDINSFFERVVAGRQEFKEVRRFEIIERFQGEISEGLFNRGSYFRKILPRILTGEQFAIYKALDDRREAYRYRAVVESVVTMWGGVVPLRSKQRRTLVRLLLDETGPPLHFSRYDYYAVLYQASRISDDRFAILLDEAQWRVLRKSLREKHLEYAGLFEAGVLPGVCNSEGNSAPDLRPPE